MPSFIWRRRRGGSSPIFDESVGSQPAVTFDEVFDSGLALERTALAWQRSVLALAVVGALVARYGVAGGDRLASNLFGVGAVVFACVLLFWVRRRYRKAHVMLKRTGKFAGRDARPLFAVFCGVWGAAVVAVVFVLVH